MHKIGSRRMVILCLVPKRKNLGQISDSSGMEQGNKPVKDVGSDDG